MTRPDCNRGSTGADGPPCERGRKLLIEQNLGVATSLAERQLIMVGGEIAAETTAEKLANDPDAQRRYVSVEPLAAH